MAMLSKYLRQSATYKVFMHFMELFSDFLDTVGKIAQIGVHVVKSIFKGEISWKELISQCDRFGVSSLPITLSIVGMTSIIVASQVAHEMVKQGGGNFVGLLMTILIVRGSRGDYVRFCNYVNDWFFAGIRTCDNACYRTG